MARKEYTEDILVQEPTARLMQEELGWRSLFAFNEESYGEEGLLGRRSQSETVLVRDLHAAIRRINPDLPEAAYEEALKIALSEDASKTLLQINEAKYKLLRDGILLKRIKHADGRVSDERVFLIDFDHPQNNDFKVVRELWVQGRLYRRRPDVIGFVNGLPLVFIELKRFEVHVDNAYKKNYRDYLDTIPRLFHWNALIVISNGADARFGSLTSALEHFYRWKRLDEDEPDPQKDQPLLPILLRGMLAKEKLLDIVENFVLFDRSEGEVAKIIARNHQYLGVNRVIERLMSKEKKTAKEVRDGKLGVFWHTQGSGKSYSMMFLSEKIHRKISAAYTFVIMTDRKELDEQIFGTFTYCGAATNKRTKARSGRQLEKLLKEDHHYVFSLIHKFHQMVEEPYTTRDNIIVISDEAHRTQYGRMAINMRKALPNAKFIGFTGTPLIENQEKQITKEVFGDYVSIYDFQRAVADGAILPLFYENRGDELEIVDEDINQRIADRIEEAKAAGELTVEEEEKLYRQLARDYPVLTSFSRLMRVADDFVEHYSQRRKTGKAMLVFIDKITCVRMYGLIQQRWQKTVQQLEAEVSAEEERFAAKGKTPDRFIKERRARIEWMRDTEMCVVVSQEQGEVEEFRKWPSDVDPEKRLDITPHRKKMVDRELGVEFKKSDNPFRVAIVCAMWLTGFDVKSLSTLYLDKPMKGHTLMQAIARVNRVGVGKKHGLIIDYNGMLKSLRKALATFAQGNKSGAGNEPDALRDDGEAIAEYGETIHAVVEFLAALGFELQPLIDTEGFDKQKLIMDAVNLLVETDARRKNFEVLAEDVQARLRAMFPNKGLFAYDKEENAIGAIYRFMQRSKQSLDVSEMLQSLYEVVDLAVETKKHDIRNTHPPYAYDLSSIDLELLKAEFERSCPNIKVLSLKEKLEKRLQAMLQQNPTRVDLYEKYQQVVEEYNQDKSDVEIQKVLDDLHHMSDLLSDEEKRYIKEGLDNQQQLAVFDLLQKDKLTQKEREQVKQVVKELMDNLVAGKLSVENYREKAITQAQIKIEIIDHLLASLPEDLYEGTEIDAKADEVFVHLMGLSDAEINQVVLH